MILWDAGGSVLAAMCTFLPYITDPTTAKAVSLWKAVSTSVDLGFQRLHMEGDALTIV